MTVKVKCKTIFNLMTVVGLIIFSTALSACNLRFLKSTEEESADNKSDRIEINCLQKLSKSVDNTNSIDSLASKGKPILIVIHGDTESGTFRPHISIEPSGQRVRHEHDLNQASTNTKSFFSHDQGLHVQIKDDESLALGSPILETQYFSLAVQTLIWQIKYGIPDTRITSEKPPKNENSVQDLQSRLDWQKFLKQKDVLIKNCQISTKKIKKKR